MAFAAVPLQATSLITTSPGAAKTLIGDSAGVVVEVSTGGSKVGVSVAVGVEVGLGSGVGVKVSVGDTLEVGVSVGVSVEVILGVGVSVGIGAAVEHHGFCMSLFDEKVTAKYCDALSREFDGL